MEEKDTRFESRSGSAPTREACPAGSGREAGGEMTSLRMASRVGMLSDSSITADVVSSLGGLFMSWAELSRPDSMVASSVLEARLEGAAGYCRGLIWVEGVGMQMLALLTSPFEVSASVKRPLRLVMTGDAAESWCELALEAMLSRLVVRSN